MMTTFTFVDPGSPSSTESPGPGSTMVTGTLGEPTEDEHGNLMWLVDFKLDFLTDIDKEDNNNNHEVSEPDKKKARADVGDTNPPPVHVAETRSNDSLRPPTMRDPTIVYQPVYPGHAPLNVPAPPPVYSRPPVPQARQVSKPNYTYTDLITLALKDKTALTVSGIYQWIS